MIQNYSYYMTPTQVASRWQRHPESIRRMLRQGQLASLVIGRRRLIAEAEVLRFETDAQIGGHVARPTNEAKN